MGKVKEEPKKVKKTEEKPKKIKSEVNLAELKSDLDTLGTWVADLDEELQSMSKTVFKMAKRMGLE